MFSSIGEPTSRVISIPTSSEDEIYRRDTSDYEQGVVEEEEGTDYETDKQIEASGLSKADPNNQVERLELLILETKAGHDGLYDEMLDMSKQIISMNIINQEQPDNFVFNYGKQIMMEKQQQQQLLAKDVFSPQITKFRRQRIIPLYKDETWSADLIDKSSLSKYNNNYKFILTVIDIFTKYAWAIPLKNKSGLSITNGFKIVLSENPQGGSESRQGGFEVRKPEK